MPNLEFAAARRPAWGPHATRRRPAHNLRATCASPAHALRPQPTPHYNLPTTSDLRTTCAN